MWVAALAVSYERVICPVEILGQKSRSAYLCVINFNCKVKTLRNINRSRISSPKIDIFYIAMRRLFAMTFMGLVATSAFAGLLPLDPGGPLVPFTTNFNDGYNGGRGMWFQANNSFTLNGAGFFNGFGAGQGFTETLYSADSAGAALHGSVLGSFTLSNPTIGNLYNTGSFAAPVNITAGSFYYLEVTSSADFNTNYFYDWNGLPGPVNVGDVTILDGGSGGDPSALGNTVAPALLLDIQTVPEPASFAALGIGMLGLLRLKKRSKI